MAKASGRFRISAPKCTRVTTTVLTLAGTDNAKNGDSTLSAAAAVGATSLSVVSGLGFKDAGQALVGYGGANQELVTISAGEGTTTLTVSATKFAHAVNERIVEYVANAPIRPGSVSVLLGATQVAYDNGLGVLVDAGGGDASTFTGTVDYSAGLINVTSGDNETGAVTFTADLIADNAVLSNDDFSGNSVFRNFQAMGLQRRDIPDVIVVTNEGAAGATQANPDTPATIGFFLEVSHSGGKNFEYVSGSARQLHYGQRAVLNVGANSGGSVLRIRCGGASTLNTPVAGITPGSAVAECDYLTMTNASGE